MFCPFRASYPRISHVTGEHNGNAVSCRTRQGRGTKMYDQGPPKLTHQVISARPIVFMMPALLQHGRLRFRFLCSEEI